MYVIGSKRRRSPIEDSCFEHSMPSSRSTQESTRTGIYNVKENGLEYQHLRGETIPKDGEEYLKRFE